MAYLHVLGCIIPTVYGQRVLTWRVSLHSQLPEAIAEKAWFLARFRTDPSVIARLFATLAASLVWMAAMATREVSHAYPIMSFAFVFVFLFRGVLLGEAFTPGKVIALTLFTAGIITTVTLRDCRGFARQLRC